MDEWVVERVLTCIEQVPRGRVISYGDIGHIVELGPRQVGAVLREHGSFVTWWRVTNSTGELPAHLHDEAFQLWAEEGIGKSANGRGCRIREFRADLDEVRASYDRRRSGTFSRSPQTTPSVRLGRLRQASAMTIRHDDRHDRGLEYDLSTLIARRRILGIFGGLGAGAVLAGCGAPEAKSSGTTSAPARTLEHEREPAS